jgi:hypothetical protein
MQIPDLGNKKKAVIIAMILILPISVFILWKAPEIFGSNEKIEISPMEVCAGETVTFTVKNNGGSGVVRLPNNTLPLVGGRISTMQNLSFLKNQFTFSALIPPTTNMINITVEGKDTTKVFKVKVNPGSDPLVSGKRTYERMAYVTDESNGISHRVTSHPQLYNGALYFRDVFQSFGLEAEIVRYGLPPSGDNPIRKAAGVFIWNVVAYHWGENTKEWIVIGGHYDMAWDTVVGAYDNTAGTNTVVEIARGISQLKTNKTIVFGLWAGEEEGLWGAQKFVDTIPEDVTVKTYLNFDMVGINYPAPFELRAIVGPDEDPDIIENGQLINLTNRTAGEILRYPFPDGVNVYEESHRGSDHYRFEEVGVPIVFFYGQSANDYDAYHTQDDTLDEMERAAGGRENLEGGFSCVAWMGFYLTLLLDGDDIIHQMR